MEQKQKNLCIQSDAKVLDLIHLFLLYTEDIWA